MLQTTNKINKQANVFQQYTDQRLRILRKEHLSFCKNTYIMLEKYCIFNDLSREIFNVRT